MVHTIHGIFQLGRQTLSTHATTHVEAHGGHFMYFLYSAGHHNSETTLQKAYIHKTFFSCIVV